MSIISRRSILQAGAAGAALMTLPHAAQSTVHKLGSGLFGTVTLPSRFPERYFEDFSAGIGNWTTPTPPIGGPREVVNGIFRSWDWSYDSNHLTTKGGPGMLHLLAYADWHYWNYHQPDGKLITSDLRNALIKLRVRGVNFAPNGSQWIVWITAHHPDFPQWPLPGNKNVNWGFIAEPRTEYLQTGSWETVEWRLDPDPAKWVWGKGADGSIYDTFLSLPESLANICNVHFPMLGPDNVGHPGGVFELDHAEFVFNRNGPGLDAPRWDKSTKASQVTLTNGELTASHSVFGANGGVRGTAPLVGKRYWEGKHVSGDITKPFAFGICNSNYVPGVHGGTFFADTVDGWGFMTDRAAKRHGNGSGFDDVSWGAVFSAGNTCMVAFDKDAGKVWFGRNGAWFNGGDPATGANPAYSGLNGDLYSAESNGTQNTSWVWRANFGATAFEYTPPSGFSGLTA